MPAPSPRRFAVAVAVTVLSLAGCGATSGGKPPGVGVVLGFVNGGTTEFHVCLQQGILSDAGANNAEVLTVNSNQDPATELANIQDMIARKVDALIVQTVNVEALKADIAKANSADIPIFLTSVTTGNTAGILGAVVVDLREVGKLDAGWVAADAAGDLAEAAVIAGAPGAASDLLVAGFKDNLPRNVVVVAGQPGMFNRAKARDVAAAMIRSHPHLRYAFVANEDMAFGALEAFTAAGAPVKIVTVNGTDAGLAAVKDGRFAATVANSAVVTGQLAVRRAVALLKKHQIEKVSNTPIKLISRQNLGDAPQYCL